MISKENSRTYCDDDDDAFNLDNFDYILCGFSIFMLFLPFTKQEQQQQQQPQQPQQQQKDKRPNETAQRWSHIVV